MLSRRCERPCSVTECIAQQWLHVPAAKGTERVFVSVTVSLQAFCSHVAVRDLALSGKEHQTNSTFIGQFTPSWLGS